jgi:plasmid stabilization system protein ParE
MAYRVELSPLALSDVEEAYLWLYEQSPSAAARWYRGLTKAIESLENHPERCSLAPESDAFAVELRQRLYGRRRGVYRILFSVAGDTVRVHRVRHGSRKFLGPD